ncbi:hypothetical protein [Urbifossiella limnaea]|uniref:Tetratricopeptide repeat protein n=1 Tax=Urbifossiella limnaea TaxID=2528023 RepID=A0A517XL72_9BACT|nr:hypothetical protein [Urbifossiella limnaea]QDU18258.1 hypothetical protein ETAA1_01410 [Urbifossiella limnaea]
MPVPCPCCKANNDAGPACRRCKADLALLFAADADASRLLAAARAALAAGRVADADALAQQSASIRRTPDALRTRAAARLMSGRFADALAAYHELAEG